MRFADAWRDRRRRMVLWFGLWLGWVPALIVADRFLDPPVEVFAVAWMTSLFTASLWLVLVQVPPLQGAL